MPRASAPTTGRRAAALLAGLAILAGCDDRATSLSPEARAQRENAYRVACTARHLVDSAEDDLETLEAAAGSSPGAGVVDYGRAYYRHAELRAIVYAYLDSAVNHAATPTDSARYVQRAGSFSTRPPTVGTVEANVAASYDRNIQALLLDEDHPCNWDIPF